MKINRRRFLQRLASIGTGLVLAQGSGLASALEEIKQGSSTYGLSGNVSPVHDPCIAKAGDDYYLFCTGAHIPVRSSPDLTEWELRGDVFNRIPAWAREIIPMADSIWAPDISHYNDKYHLYYSVSTFGSNRSVIGLATNTTLDPDDGEYAWVDEELVVESQSTDNFNAIDPNLVIDEDGTPWLAFGSFWSGIKMLRLDPDTGKPSSEDDTLYSLATRPDEPGAVEAPFVIRRGDDYYLFVSFDFCCRGVTSTYRVMVGRSEEVTGPYIDREGVPMLEGGGTQVTFPSARWRGPGHNAILQEDEQDFVVYHAYDSTRVGIPTLRIEPLTWDEDGWPSLEREELEEAED